MKGRRRAVGLLFVLVALALVCVWARRRLPDFVAPATDFGVVPFASSAPSVETPETEPGRALVAHLVEIEAATRSSRYAHTTDVDVAAGRYHWDCSGMVGWLVRRHAPRAFRSLGRGRPVAADFARTIDRGAPGWDRVERLQDVRAGDVFAWRSPPELRRDGSTGHVGIVLAAPRRALALGDVWQVRIADSTTVPHERDTRLEHGDTDGGLGIGVMTFVAGEGGASHYGWAGVLSPLYVEADVVFGRLEG